MHTERYNRQIILNGFGETAQNKLARAKVLVVGAGGLGCPALQYLVAAGIGNIGIADEDVVELSNLHRQILFTMQDIGQAKAVVAAARLQEMNPEVKFQIHPKYICLENVIQILSGYDFVLDGSDNFKTRYLINDTCMMLKIPLIFAAVSGYEGQLAIFNVADSSGISTNYRDLFPIRPNAGEIPNCAENGTLGVLPGIIGTMAAAETIKLITGIGKPLINILLHYNVLTHQKYSVNISPGAGYLKITNEEDLKKMNNELVETNHKAFEEIDGEKLTVLQNQQNTIFIDVRERHEFPKLDTSIFTQVPMSEFEAFLQEDVSAQHIVLLCQHGIRSVAAAELLNEKYNGEKNMYSLKGGIVKWMKYFK